MAQLESKALRGSDQVRQLPIGSRPLRGLKGMSRSRVESFWPLEQGSRALAGQTGAERYGGPRVDSEGPGGTRFRLD